MTASIAILIASLGSLPDDARPDRPNVLFVTVDDLNDWVGFLKGHPGVKTPNLDRLAARGVAFTRAYCAAPACNPSRTAVLCGLRPSTSGVYHNDQPWRPALPDAVTLPQHFAAAGYDVAGAGKIFHNSFNESKSWGAYLAPPGGGPEPPDRPVNGIARAGHFDWGPIDADDDAMGDARVVARAAEFLDRDRERPFFLAVGLTRPHLPWYVPSKYFDMFPASEVRLPEVKADDLDDLPFAALKMAKPQGDHAKVLAADQWPQAVRAYLASIAFADAMIGRLIDALDRSPHAANTIVVLWGDHGWHLGEKEHWRKFALWERATRVPLVVVAPGRAPAGARCERTVSLIDLYPTLIDLCSLPPRDGLEGRSIAPLVADPAAARAEPALTTHGRGHHAVRTDRWRYIRYADGGEELYDHEADPREWTNLAGDPATAEVRRELAAWLPKSDAPDAPRARAARD